MEAQMLKFVDNRGVNPLLALYKDGEIYSFVGAGNAEDFINAAVIAGITIIENKKLSKDAFLREVEGRIDEYLRKSMCVQ